MTKKRIEPIRRLDRWNDKKVWLIKHYPDGALFPVTRSMFDRFCTVLNEDDKRCLK